MTARLKPPALMMMMMMIMAIAMKTGMIEIYHYD